MAHMVNLKGKYAQYEPYVEDIISNIKDLMEEALKAKDKDQVTKYQEQIWNLKDFKVGYLNNINEKVLTEAFELYKASIERESHREPSKILTDREKKLKALIKKREQIKGLIEKQAKGEKLEKNQLDKISTLDKIEEEIEQLEN